LEKEKRYQEKIKAQMEQERQALIVKTTAPPPMSSSATSAGRVKNGLGMEFVRIAPGSFEMGSPSGETGRGSDETQHRVTLTRGYYLQTTEVTQGQWKAVMGSNPSRFSSCGDVCPVENVSWDDVQSFISKLNAKGRGTYRLPTEAEWEHACRAGTTTARQWGEGIGSGNANCGGCGSRWDYKGTAPVRSFAPNAWGLYDMPGNVEWCSDWYGEYPGGAVSDPAGPGGGSLRVYRGGSWTDRPAIVRSADRAGFSPGLRDVSLGFRLARAE
jgi:formylglycine-generating enzyme required for sulfatase activity